MWKSYCKRLSRYYKGDKMTEKKLICGKCGTEQIMFKRFYGKKENEFSWYCPKCNDLISQSAVREVKEK
jgi:hypothetical protein